MGTPNFRVRNRRISQLSRRLLTPETYASDDLDALKALKAHRLDADGEEVWMRTDLGEAETGLERLDAEKSPQFLPP